MKTFRDYLAEAESKYQQNIVEFNSNDLSANDSISPISGGTVTPDYVKKMISRPSHRKPTKKKVAK